MDRRLLACNGRVAARHLKGLVEAENYVDPKRHRIGAPVADLLSAPDGVRDRQILHGAHFDVLEVRDGMAFGFSEADGYVGWITEGAFMRHALPPLTHKIGAARSYCKDTPGLKTMNRPWIEPMPFGTALTILDESDGWAKFENKAGAITHNLYIPIQHLVPIDTFGTDPAAVAERLIGTPYLWGGNSSFGIDCSGLVQAALLACATPCPGDSDLQEDSFPDGTGAYQRGDLLFWKGHVAMVTGANTMIHANAFHMAVAYEPIDTAIARIQSQGDGPVTSHKRPILGAST